jgi:hypothetical protein
MACQIRHAKFTAEAWKSKSTLDIISRIAGVDLVPVIDYEIGHINISVPGTIKENKEGVLVAEDDGKAVVDWHRDSYPFVCVLMMSDTAGMVGPTKVITSCSIASLYQVLTNTGLCCRPAR